MRFPVVARVANLLRRARDEVPPHENRFRERHAANQQETSAAAAPEAHLRALRSEIVEDAVLQALSFKRALTREDQQRMLMLWLEWNGELVSRVNLEVRRF